MVFIRLIAAAVSKIQLGDYSVLYFLRGPKWRNGRRAGLKNRWDNIPCQFESDLRHQQLNTLTVECQYGLNQDDGGSRAAINSLCSSVIAGPDGNCSDLMRFLTDPMRPPTPSATLMSRQLARRKVAEKYAVGAQRCTDLTLRK